MAFSLGLKSVHEERRMMKLGLGIGLGAMTLGLSFVNGTGAWVSTNSGAFTLLAIGAEVALVFMFSLVVLSETRLRQIIGFLIFAGLAWFCVENGKAGIRHWMQDVFVGSPEALRAEADVLDGEALKLDTLPDEAKGEATEQRRLDREELAALRVEQKQMQAQDPQGIEDAQLALKAQGKYRGPIDGIRAELTEAAMEQRGAEIAGRIAILQAKLDEDVGGQAEMALAPAQERRLKAIELRTQAKGVEKAERWAQILLIVAEAARSFGVWAFLMAGTRKTARVNVEVPGQGQMTEDEMAAIDAALEKFMTPTPEGETKMTPSERGRKGAQAANLGRKAKGVDTRIPVDPPEAAA